MRNISVKIFDLDQWFSRRYRLKYYLEFWQQSWLAECNQLGSFGKGHYDEHFCEIILNFDKWLRVILRYLLSRALTAIFFGRTEPFRNLGNGPMDEQFYEVISNLGQ